MKAYLSAEDLCITQVDVSRISPEGCCCATSGKLFELEREGLVLIMKVVVFLEWAREGSPCNPSCLRGVFTQSLVWRRFWGQILGRRAKLFQLELNRLEIFLKWDTQWVRNYNLQDLREAVRDFVENLTKVTNRQEVAPPRRKKQINSSDKHHVPNSGTETFELVVAESWLLPGEPFVRPRIPRWTHFDCVCLCRKSLWPHKMFANAAANWRGLSFGEEELFPPGWASLGGDFLYND